MKVANAVAEILRREGIELLIGYPVNPIIEAAAEADIRTIMVRQERIGLHMCDAIAKVTSGDRIGVVAMQHGPGTENAFGGVAQSWGDSCPVVVLPAGYARNINQVRPNFNAALNYRNVTKWCEQVTVPDATVEALRRAFTQVKNGRPGPVLIEFPSDLLREEISGPLDYQKTPQLKSGPDPRSVAEIAAALVEAQRPVIVAGQGVHYGKAWKQLQDLAELLEAPVMTTLPGKRAVTGEIRSLKGEWMEQWMPRLTQNTKPLSPYRVIWELLHTVDVKETIITHDAGSPRDQLSPFWVSQTPLGYIGWGKTTQLGYGLGLAMGAKLAKPEKLCINVWGDAAIGFTGMDFETAVRERIPILSILMNNFSMAIELKVMPVSTEKYRSTDISGHYADFAKALGGYDERVTDPGQIIPAIKRGIAKTREGTPVLLEFITEKATDVSRFP